MTAKNEFGPEFLQISSWLYRAEYAVVSVVIASYLVWRAFFAGGIDLLQTFIWVIFPDLVAFVLIGLSSKRREWPG